MSVLVGFAPWILYWVLVSNNTFEEAAVAGLVASVAMVVMGFSSLVAQHWPEDELWWNWIVPIGALVAAIKFTAWYPHRLRQEAGLGPRSA